MIPTPRTRDDLLLTLIIGALGLATAYGACVWSAATLILLVHEHRLLDHASPGALDTGSALLTNPRTPSAAFAPRDALALPRDPWLHLCALPIAAVLAIAGTLAWRAVRGSSLVRDDAESRWASARDIRRVAASASDADDRLVLGTAHGKNIIIDNCHSVIVFGPTDSGKTTAVVIPALLRHRGPVVALSSKGNLVRTTHEARERIGPVHVYDPMGITDHDCIAWTPLRTCHEWDDAQDVADTLTSVVGSSGLAESRFWDGMAAKLLQPLLHAAALEDLTMRHVVRWVNEREVEGVINILDAHGSTDAIESLRATQAHEPRTLSNAYASAEMVLRAYASSRMADHRPSQSLDPVTLLTDNATLYVCSPKKGQARLRPVFAALVQDIHDTAVLHAERSGQPLDPSLLLVLDEAANIAPIHDLAEIASTCREYAIQLVTIFQDLAQVTARYKDQAPTVVNNHTAKLVLPGTSDRELLELMTRLVGEHTTEHDTTSSGPSGETHSTQLRQRPLAAIHQLRQLTRNHALLLYANLPPLVIRLKPYYERKDAA
jgi:type IV secretory pathway TraG/TraD family ATPase VirD4